MKILKSIRRKCLVCCCNSDNEINLCPDKDCGLYQLRFGKNENNLDELKQIGIKCFDCSAAGASDNDKQIKEKIKNCPIENCPIFEHRQW